MNCLIADNFDYLLEKCDEYDAYSKKDHLLFMQQRFDRYFKSAFHDIFSLILS